MRERDFDTPNFYQQLEKVDLSPRSLKIKAKKARSMELDSLGEWKIDELNPLPGEILLICMSFNFLPSVTRS
jgi:hypothetical protein